jgi:hypothetical protein
VQSVNTQADVLERKTFVTSNNLDQIFLEGVPEKCYLEECLKLDTDDECNNDNWKKT